MARNQYLWAPSAGKHGVLRKNAAYVIDHCGCPLVLPAEPPDRPDERLLFLGDARDGTALEVVAVELADGRLRVIHAMTMRTQYARLYRDVKQWRL